jgi:hypothetical protein
MANEFIARNGIIAKNNTVITGSLTVTAGITGSLSGSATNATSASYALTASYAMNGGGGGGAAFPYNGAAVISGSLLVSGSGITVTGSLVTTKDITVNFITIGRGIGTFNANNLGIGNNGVLSSAGSGQYNTGVGSAALSATTDGSYNNGFGAGTLLSNTTGQLNTAIGHYALAGNKTGSRNTGIGAQALNGGVNGSYNTALGYNAGSSLQGNYNTIIGIWDGAVSVNNNVVLSDGQGNARFKWDGSNLYLPGVASGTTSNTFYYNSSTGVVTYGPVSGSGGGGSTFPYTGNAVISGSLKVSGSGITVTGSVAVSGSLNGNTYQLNGDGSGYLASNNIHWNDGGDLYLDNASIHIEGNVNSNQNVYYLDGGNGSGYLANNNISWDNYGQLYMNYGNYIYVDGYGVNSRFSSYLFLGDYNDSNYGTTLFVDDSQQLIKFGNFNSGGGFTNDGANMVITAQIGTNNPGGFLGKGGASGISWNNSGTTLIGDWNGDTENNVLAIYQGYTSNDPVFVFNVPNSDNGNIAQFNFDGSGYLANSNITWDVNGNLKTNTIGVWDNPNAAYATITGDDGVMEFKASNGHTMLHIEDGYGIIINSIADIRTNTLSGNRAYDLPDKSGSFALTSDLGTYTTGVVTPSTSHYISLKLADGNTYKVLVAN